MMRSVGWMLTLLLLVLVACGQGVLPGAGPAGIAPTPRPPTRDARQPTPDGIFQPVPTGGTTALVGTPAPTSAAQPGSRSVTRDANGQTLELTVGETFVLRLGEGYSWATRFSDERVVALDPTVLPPPGAQGVFRALAAGRSELNAVGEALCRQEQPPCMQPSLQFDLTIVVR